MLIVLSSAASVQNEAQLINNLFASGLKIFHLRKPGAAEIEIINLIKKIDARYHSKIALHQHHQMANVFSINRLHFTEVKRKQISSAALENLQKEGNILTTSIHQVSEYEALQSCFDYTFFGPVFNSISKQGYNSKMEDDFKMPFLQNHPKAIAIGGITANNLQEALNKQFDGVAALGTIWRLPEQSNQQFKILQTAWNQTGPQY